MIRQYCQPEPLSENETEYDVEEAEDIMNSVPSPKQQAYRFWNPDYEARRQARKRLWSPPLTPPRSPGCPHTPYNPVNALRIQPASSLYHLATIRRALHRVSYPRSSCALLLKSSTAGSANPDRLRYFTAQLPPR